jgi:hypothetical protein
MFSSTALGLRLRLPDNGEIVASRDLAELVAGADQACTERQRFSFNACACAGPCETLPDRFDRSFVMPFNHFQFGRNIAGARNRHDRTVKENDPRQVSI